MPDGPLPADRRLSPVIRLAPAKLNLTLAVEGRRADGFHGLHSVMAPLGLADRLSLASAVGGDDTLDSTGFDAGPSGGNLVLRAIAETRAALGREVPTPALAARLEKHVPVAAGLGGGSSDAAAAIDAALEAWGAASVLDAAQLEDLRRGVAVRLGSDVPFFLAAAAAVISGRGEVVDPLPPLRGPAPGVLLVTPGAGLATAAVFAAFDTDLAAGPRDQRSTRASSEHLAVEWRAGLRCDDLVARAGVLASANDLAQAADAILPGLRPLRRALGRVLHRPVGLSGSGPTLWVLYASVTEAASAANAVRAGLDDGPIVAPDVGRPSIAATTIEVVARVPDPESRQEATA